MTADRLRGGRLAIGAILVAGLAVRLPFLGSATSVSGDPRLIGEWVDLLVGGGTRALLDGSGDLVLYPPLAIAGLWLGGVIATAAGGLVPEALVGHVVVRALAIAGDLALALLLVKLLAGRPRWLHASAAAAVALNPDFWYVAGPGGQIDSVYVACMVAAVATAGATGRPATSWVGAAAAGLWKLQGLAVAPLVGARAIVDHGWVRAVAGAVLAGALGLALLLVLFPGPDLGSYLGRLVPRPGPATVSAFNGWYLLTRDLGGQPHGVLAGLSEPLVQRLGLLALAGITAFVVWGVLREPRRAGLALPAATLSLAPFVVMGGISACRRRRFRTSTLRSRPAEPAKRAWPRSAASMAPRRSASS